MSIKTPAERLREKLREAFDTSDPSMSEEEALEAALEEAESWRMRLDELKDQ